MSTFTSFWTLAWTEKNKIPVFWAPTCGSTQDLAKNDFPISGATEKIYLTRIQTAGRGRKKDRNWESFPECDQLLATWCFKVNEASMWFPLRVGLALYNALAIFPEHETISLKAPNDVFLGDQKIAGLLIEILQQGSDFFVMVGLGLNVSGTARLSTAQVLFDRDNEPTENEWNSFLDRWYLLLKKALSPSTALTSQEKSELIIALNRHPLLAEEIRDIDESGSLVTATQTISWRSL